MTNMYRYCTPEHARCHFCSQKCYCKGVISLPEMCPTFSFLQCRTPMVYRYIRPTFLMQFPKDLLRRRGRKGKKRNEGGENGIYIGPKRKRERRRRIAKLDSSKEEGKLFFVLFSIWKKNRVLLHDRRTTLPTTLRTGRRVFSFKGDRNQSSILPPPSPRRESKFDLSSYL